MFVVINKRCKRIFTMLQRTIFPYERVIWNNRNNLNRRVFKAASGIVQEKQKLCRNIFLWCILKHVYYTILNRTYDESNIF